MRSLRFAAATLLGSGVFVAPAAAVTRPTLTIGVPSSTAVDDVLVPVTGRVTAVPRGTKTVLQRNVGTGWTKVRSVTVGADGVVRSAYRPIVGPNNIRLVLPAGRSWSRGTSRSVALTVVPQATPPDPRVGDIVAVSGHLPTPLSRPVRLQLEGANGWRTVATAKSSTEGAFLLRTRLNDSARVRIEAPKTVVRKVKWPAFVSPARSIWMVVDPPAEAPAPVDLVTGESIEWKPEESEPPSETAAEPTPEPTVDATDDPVNETAGTLESSEPRVVGRLEVGATLTAATETWGPGQVGLAHQWRRDGADIEGAEGSSYVLTDDDTGSRMSVAVTGSRDGFAAQTRVSGESAVVTEPVCSGEPPTKQDGSAWRCAFSDEFDGESLDRSKWVPQQTSLSGIKSGPGCIVDDENNVFVREGNLHLVARSEPAPFVCRSPNGDTTTEYTNGSVTSFGRFSQAFGRYEFRAKFPDVSVAGLQSALWLYPIVQYYGAWPRSGEIDVAEVYSRYPDRAIPYVHYRTADPDDRSVTNTACKLNPAEFHTYVLEWTTTAITISYDGVVCLAHTIAPAWPMPAPQPFGRPFAVIMSQVQGRDGANGFDAETTPLPATMLVDYVRVWK